MWCSRPPSPSRAQNEYFISNTPICPTDLPLSRVKKGQLLVILPFLAVKIIKESRRKGKPKK